MKRLIAFALPVALLGLSGLVAVGLASARSTTPQRTHAAATAPVVEVISVTAGDVPVTVQSLGVIGAVQEVDIAPPVTGLITWVTSGLHAGLAFEAGDAIARIDDVSYKAAIAEAQTRVATAEQALALERGRGDVAALESTLVGEVTGANTALVMRGPQLAAAEAELAAATASLAKAERDLALTVLRAPFDAILVEESLDVGRNVTNGTALGRWVGTEQVQISLSLSLSALSHIDPGAPASITLQGSSDTRVRIGEVLGVTGALDSATRTATALVTVDNPYDTTHGPALMPGGFAQVELGGLVIEDAFRVPETALIDGSAVWVVDTEGLLARVPVEVAWRDTEAVVVRGDLPGNLVLTDPSGSLLAGQAVEAVEG